MLICCGSVRPKRETTSWPNGATFGKSWENESEVVDFCWLKGLLKLMRWYRIKGLVCKAVGLKEILLGSSGFFSFLFFFFLFSSFLKPCHHLISHLNRWLNLCAICTFVSFCIWENSVSFMCHMNWRNVSLSRVSQSRAGKPWFLFPRDPVFTRRPCVLISGGFMAHFVDVFTVKDIKGKEQRGCHSLTTDLHKKTKGNLWS